MRARFIALTLVSIFVAAGCGGSASIGDGPGGHTGGGWHRDRSAEAEGRQQPARTARAG